MRELGEWEEVGGHSVIALLFEWAIRRRPAIALQLCAAALKTTSATIGNVGGWSREEHEDQILVLYLLRVSLYDCLEWPALADRERTHILRHFPATPGYQPF